MEYQGIISFLIYLPQALSDVLSRANNLLGGFGLTLLAVFSGVGLFVLLTVKLVRLFVI